MKVKVLKTLCAKENRIPVYCEAGRILEGDKTTFPKCVQDVLAECRTDLVKIIVDDVIETVAEAVKELKPATVEAVKEPVVEKSVEKDVENPKVVAPVARKRRGL